MLVVGQSTTKHLRQQTKVPLLAALTPDIPQLTDPKVADQTPVLKMKKKRKKGKQPIHLCNQIKSKNSS